MGVSSNYVLDVEKGRKSVFKLYSSCKTLLMHWFYCFVFTPQPVSITKVLIPYLYVVLYCAIHMEEKNNMCVVFTYFLVTSYLQALFNNKHSVSLIFFYPDIMNSICKKTKLATLIMYINRYRLP
jgi:hypothetical protein